MVHQFPVVNEADTLTWPILEHLRCQYISGQTWPIPGNRAPDVNSGTVPAILGRLVALSKNCRSLLQLLLD